MIHPPRCRTVRVRERVPGTVFKPPLPHYTHLDFSGLLWRRALTEAEFKEPLEKVAVPFQFNKIFEPKEPQENVFQGIIFLQTPPTGCHCIFLLSRSRSFPGLH